MQKTPVARIHFALMAAAVLAPLATAPDADALCGMRRLPRAYYEARQAEARGDVEEAVRLFSVAARYPGQAKYWIASAYRAAGAKASKAGETMRAIDYYKRSLAAYPSHHGAAHGLISVLTGSGRYHEALDAFTVLPASIANTPRMLRQRAQLQARVRDREGLRKTIELLRTGGHLKPADLDLLRGSGGIKFQGPGALGRL